MKFIENSNEGVHCYNRFSADFSDNIVKLNNRDYPLGTVSKMTANISKNEMDEILKLGGKALNCYQTISVLGYNRNVFLIHKGVILDMLSYMKKLEIFQCFDYEESIGIDTANFATAVQNFTAKLMEKTSRQKSELAKTAFELFNDELFMFFLEQSNPAGKIMWGFSVKSMNTVVPVIDEVNGDYKILRRVYFSRMMDFFVMDFFEALSHGHYLWQCGICGKYFLMTTAHRQLYCEEKNPKYGAPCKYVAKHPELTSEKKETQKKSDTPIRVLWKKRDNTIRQRKSRHKYSDAEFEAAKEYIMDCYEQAQTDFDYAAEQYEKDMELTAIDEYVRRVTDV